ERAMRDLRINLIFEGSSEIMRLFIAREAVDPHLQRAGAMVDAEAPAAARAKGALSLGAHLAGWVPGLLAGRGIVPGSYNEYGPLAGHVRVIERYARRLGRALFYAMTRYGPKLEKRQAVLFRMVDIGAELFAMAATCVRARHMLAANPADEGPGRLADLFCRHARQRIERSFDELFRNHDLRTYRLA